MYHICAGPENRLVKVGSVVAQWFGTWHNKPGSSHVEINTSGEEGLSVETDTFFLQSVGDHFVRDKIALYFIDGFLLCIKFCSHSLKLVDIPLQ